MTRQHLTLRSTLTIVIPLALSAITTYVTLPRLIRSYRLWANGLSTPAEVLAYWSFVRGTPKMVYMFILPHGHTRYCPRTPGSTAPRWVQDEQRPSNPTEVEVLYLASDPWVNAPAEGPDSPKSSMFGSAVVGLLFAVIPLALALCVVTGRPIVGRKVTLKVLELYALVGIVTGIVVIFPPLFSARATDPPRGKESLPLQNKSVCLVLLEDYEGAPGHKDLDIRRVAKDMLEWAGLTVRENGSTDGEVQLHVWGAPVGASYEDGAFGYLGAKIRAKLVMSLGGKTCVESLVGEERPPDALRVPAGGPPEVERDKTRAPFCYALLRAGFLAKFSSVISELLPVDRASCLLGAVRGRFLGCKSEAMQLLGAMRGRGTELLIEELRQGNTDAQWALHDTGDPAATEPLLSVLATAIRDDNPRQALAAIHALEGAGDHRCLGPLRALAKGDLVGGIQRDVLAAVQNIERRLAR